jgi:transcription antitermination factor NusG
MQTTLTLTNTKPLWLAFRVIPRREKHVVHSLLRQGVEAWIPLQERVKRYKRKVRKVQYPLITQYVFARVRRNELAKVLSTTGVVQVLRPSGYIDPIPADEIELLKRIVGEWHDVEVEAGEWKEGDEVEIVAGQLTGLKGRLMEWRGKNRVGIRMAHFQHTMIIEVPLNTLRKI